VGGTVMNNWKYGIVHKKLKDGTDWYYVAEIYDDGGHTDGQTFLNGLGGESIDEVKEVLEIINLDLVDPLVIEDVDND
jgi:hypothetical protein